MTRALEVRLFWGDALLEVQHHVLREGMKVAGAALLEGSAATLASLERGALVLAGERYGALNVVEHGALSVVMGVVELAPLDRGPREGQPLASAFLFAMALHASLLAAGMSSPQTDALSLDDLPRPLAARPRVATVVTSSTVHAESASGGAASPSMPNVGAPSETRRARAGGHRVAHPVPPNLLAVLGGVADRLGSGGAGYDVSNLPGAPDLRLIPDDLRAMSGSRSATCGGPPPGCSGNRLATAAGFGVPRVGLPSNAPDGGFAARCPPNEACMVPRIRTCTAACADTRGALSREVVRRVIGRHRNEVVFCYEQALQGRPDLSGRVSTSFVIDAEGSVTSASARSDELPDVAQCVARVLDRMHFPASDRPTAVTYPFDFTRGE